MATRLPYIVDVGTHTARIGIAGQTEPSLVAPAMVGSITRASHVGAMDPVLFPLSPSARLDCVDVKPCLAFNQESGTYEVTDDFGVAVEAGLGQAERQSLLVVEPTRHDPAFRAAVAELMFEQASASTLFFGKAAALAAYAMARVSGTIVDMGHSQATCAVLKDGLILQNSVHSCTQLGGVELTKRVGSLLRSETLPPLYTHTPETDNHSPADWLNSALDRPSTEADCFLEPSYVAWSLKATVESFKTFYGGLAENANEMQTLKLPDGVKLDSLNIAKAVDECLFGKRSKTSVRNLVRSSLFGAQKDHHGTVPENAKVLLSTGGGSLFGGFNERLATAFEGMALEFPNKPPLCPPRWRHIVLSRPAERRSAAWIGGSILGSLGEFLQLSVTREDYQEKGDQAFDTACP